MNELPILQVKCLPAPFQHFKGTELFTVCTWGFSNISSITASGRKVYSEMNRDDNLLCSFNTCPFFWKRQSDDGNNENTKLKTAL